MFILVTFHYFHSALYSSFCRKNPHWIFCKLPVDNFLHSASCKILLPAFYTLEICTSTDLHFTPGRQLVTVNSSLIIKASFVIIGTPVRRYPETVLNTDSVLSIITASIQRDDGPLIRANVLIRGPCRRHMQCRAVTSAVSDIFGYRTARGYANSRTGHLADWSTSGLVISQTGQLTDTDCVDIK